MCLQLIIKSTKKKIKPQRKVILTIGFLKDNELWGLSEKKPLQMSLQFSFYFLIEDSY